MKEKIAFLGGCPVRRDFLPFHRPLLGDKEKDEVIKVLDSGWISTGPKAAQFEEEFSRYIGCRYAVALNSCTAGLHLSLIALDVKEGDEVITSSIAFPSIANVIEHQRAKPIFVDIELDTLNIDVNKIEEKITSRTRAIMPVHFAGHPCEMDRILEIAKKNNLYVIEDAAHAIGAEYNGRKIGNIGLLTNFSFYATKNITTAEGGILTTNNKKLADEIRILSFHGMDKNTWKRRSTRKYHHWNIIYPGYKYNMSDVQAAIGIYQMEKIEDFLNIRKKYVKMYNEGFKEVREIKPLVIRDNIKHAYHLYVIIIKIEQLGVSRDTILNAILAENVGIGVHFRAIHYHPYYRKSINLQPGSLPNAEYISERVVSLPLYPGMTEDDVYSVIRAVKKVIFYYLRKK